MALVADMVRDFLDYIQFDVYYSYSRFLLCLPSMRPGSTKLMTSVKRIASSTATTGTCSLKWRSIHIMVPTSRIREPLLQTVVGKSTCPSVLFFQQLTSCRPVNVQHKYPVRSLVASSILHTSILLLPVPHMVLITLPLRWAMDILAAALLYT